MARTWRQKFFAWGIDLVMRVYEPRIAPRKQALFGGLRGKVVEIGPGTGPNLKYFDPSIEYMGIDPNVFMHPYLVREANRLGMSQVQMLEGTAAQIPLPDGSVDAVVGTLVLCSVPHQAEVLAEVRRVLKPGGRYYFIEHVAAESLTWTSFVQRLIKPLWCCCADGCHVDRKSWEAIEVAGFAEVEMERFRLDFPVVAPHIMGSARR